MVTHSHPEVCSDTSSVGAGAPFPQYRCPLLCRGEIVIKTASVRSSSNRSLEEEKGKEEAAGSFVVAPRLILR